MTRLQLLPVSFMTLLAGKLVAYVMVCMAQFALMMLIGRFIMPLLGTSPLTLDQAWGAIGVVLLSVALAATAVNRAATLWFAVVLGAAVLPSALRLARGPAMATQQADGRA